MTTEIIHTIGTSGDYTSIAAWEAAQQRDLVAADEIAIGHLIDNKVYARENINFFGWVSDSTRVPILRGYGNGKAGESWNDSGATIAFPVSYWDKTFISADCYYIIDHVKIHKADGASSSSYNYGIFRLFNTGKGVKVTNSLIKASVSYPINHKYLNGYGVLKFSLCKFYGQLRIGEGDSNLYLYGCLVPDGESVINSYSSARDVWYNSALLGTNAANGANGSNNISNNGTSIGSGQVATTINLAATYVDYTNDDYHILPSSIANKAGVDYPSIYTIDIDGDQIPLGEYPVGRDWISNKSNSVDIISENNVTSEYYSAAIVNSEYLSSLKIW